MADPPDTVRPRAVLRSATPPNLLSAALAYARRGLPVFPCRPGGKAPITPGGFMDAALDEAAIRARWSRTPAANVAVPTGRRSGLLVLDVDADAGGFEALAALEKEGSLPKTSRARTGGGGMHVYFKYPRSHPWDVKNSASLLGRGLDVRGEGGYVLVPPSVTQGPYRWTDRAPLAHAHWLLDRLRDLEGPTLF